MIYFLLGISLLNLVVIVFHTVTLKLHNEILKALVDDKVKETK